MNNEITPPPELVEQWYLNGPENDELGLVEYVAIQAAHWGADQELEACCHCFARDLRESLALELRARRRPKPPSLKKQALEALAVLAAECYGNTDKPELIRRALETLSD